ncbi:MAG: hypothetical protein DI537_20625 [Stutzerimonas stutzeri]|nr:MAG: hypothetical protein DI537_20625 [Stutzerimonas stutzeri]
MAPEDYKVWVDENIRLIILKDLADPRSGGSTNTYLIQKSLERFSYRKTRDYIRNQLLWMEENTGALKTRTEGTETSAVITRSGRDHVEGRHYLAGIQHPGDAE